MTWFTVLKGLTPEEKRQTYDFWPPEDMPLTWNKSKWPKEKMNAYQRLKRRNFKREPTKEEVEEEMKNPKRIKSGRTVEVSGDIPLEYPKHWQDNIRLRPDNYNKINNIVIYLKTQNKPINRQSILEEMVGSPTNEDNSAIEYILEEFKK